MKPRSLKLPHPRKARIAAGLKWRALAATAQVSTATISACEKSGKYPRQRAIRASYLAALNLTEKAAS